ncbi:Cytochrome P450 71A1 [Acorus calamus]|uniref:Cytochrome P450 71A1 n=1 Tax=Acorus calamus TaxID=4465 RepID=A0AAV9D302_ACOCL|nr:Cytochrome P450 71A1 [Acorus calamus]
MIIHLSLTPTLVISSAEAAEEVMKKHDHAFANRPTLEAAKVLRYGGRDTVFSPYGNYWRNVKKMSTLHLLSTKRVQLFQPLREQEVARMIESIITSSARSPSVNLSQILNSFSNNIIIRAVSGMYCFREGKCEEIRRLAEENVNLIGEFNLGDYFPSLAWLNKLNGFDAKLREAFHKCDAMINELIDDHIRTKNERNIDDHNFVDALLSLKDNESSDFSLTKDDIKAIIVCSFAAATDTSYVTLEWAMAELLNNPREMKAVQDEVRSIGKTDKSMVSEDDIARMKYLKAVIKETLRLHPPAPLLVPRESTEETDIGGYKIPARTRAIINVWAIGRDPKYWEASEEFRPERFFENPIDFRGNDFHFIPFGAGRRKCPGMNYGVASVEVALANLLYRFDWHLPTGEAFDMVEAPGMTVHKKSALNVVARPY